jgi:type IV pilus assembly protein PilB
MQKTHHPIGKLLLSANLISESDLIRCLQIQKETGEKLRDIVVKEGLITEEQIVQLLAEQMGFPYIDLRRVEVKEDALKIINEDTAKRNTIFPVSVKDNVLTIATSDPLNMSVMDDLYLITGYEMNVVVATSNDIEWAINRYYLPQGQKQNVPDEDQDPEETKILELDEVEEQNAPAITLTQSIITKAVARKASDIHIEQHEKEMLVRYRIDGVLHDIMVIPETLRPAVLSRLKIMANLSITEKRKPQDGGFHIRIDQHLLDVRMST